MVSSGYHGFRASGNGLAAPVLAGPFSQGVKNKTPFLQKSK